MQRRAGRGRDAERWSESVEIGATGRVLPETPVGKYPLSCPTPVKMFVVAAIFGRQKTDTLATAACDVSVVKHRARAVCNHFSQYLC